MKEGNSPKKEDPQKHNKVEGRTHTMEEQRRRSYDMKRHSILSETLVSHALREVVSDHIMAGPHGALQPVTSLSSMQLRESQRSGSRHTVLALSLADVQLPVLFEDAIIETSHGCFQYKLMALCGFIYSCCSLSTTTLSFVLPAAQYDFKLTSIDKGVLNTAPLFGMVAGAYIWGNFADNKGRRFVLLYSLLIDAFAAFSSSFCQTFTLFFICRVFNGFGIIGATSIVFAYLGEFLNVSKRDRYLSRLELFWTFGIIALPVIGFAILPRDWEIGNNVFSFNSWRIFVFACGIPSFIAAVLIALMPESPRFLYFKGYYEKTKDVLVRMYKSNTGKTREDFPVQVLYTDGDEEHHLKHGASRWVKVKHVIKGILKQHKILFKGHSLFNIIITCFIDFGLMSVYYTFMLWVPELLHRHARYLEAHSAESAFICTAVKEPESLQGDDEKVDYHTLIHTFIICFACLPSNFMLLCLIQFVSKKALLVTFLVGAAGPTFALYFMDTEFKLTTMLCLFEAIATLVEAILFCAIVEIFPLSTRGSALSLTVTVGRLGAILGNIVFGLSLETHCRELFFSMSGLLLFSGLAALLLPKMSGGH
ncbi:synaptic vesicle glycoprotein 2B-like [Macrosteles quadrilineatus]|uniref:synaptic vesicle glycoprotein 2B-like n=1 Tax=Macrosteles quadrilineatus TaxID=74068 RepID=UPI0023E143C2|nr:synaptic vesicle glycoprotein 2B-like [Macrosteles quadrilineatus]